MKPSRAVLILLLVMGLCGHAVADIAPRSLAELERSDAIVVGTIESIRIETERSRIETAFGNYDWGIYLQLRIERVEKGELTDASIEMRCFRVKSRRSATESISFTGHHPIPGIGSRVRVYLVRGANGWEAALPNGITSIDARDGGAVDESTSVPLSDADQVTALKSFPYTYGLPLELWGIALVVGLPVCLVPLFFLRRRRARHRSGCNQSPPLPSTTDPTTTNSMTTDPTE